MNLNLHIEKLVLDGLPVEPRQAAQLQAALQRELARLLAAGSLPAGFDTGASARALKGVSIQFAQDATAAGLGQQIAAAVYGGFAGPS